MNSIIGYFIKIVMIFCIDIIIASSICYWLILLPYLNRICNVYTDYYLLYSINYDNYNYLFYLLYSINYYCYLYYLIS